MFLSALDRSLGSFLTVVCFSLLQPSFELSIVRFCLSLRVLACIASCFLFLGLHFGPDVSVQFKGIYMLNGGREGSLLFNVGLEKVILVGWGGAFQVLVF